VLIVYFSAVVEQDGQVYFLEDTYGHDKELAKLESQAYASNN
jgi:murein L,D-transpeptidase YcbB/YkuD